MKVLTNIAWGGLYDYDETTGKLTKVLKCYHEGDSFTLERFDYEYLPEQYTEAGDIDFTLYGEQYYPKADGE